MTLKQFESTVSKNEGNHLNFTRKNTTVGWVLCLPQFKDIALIAPEGLNDILIDSNYQEVLNKQIKTEYFNHILLYKVLMVYSIIGNSTRITTPRIPHAIAKELCNLLDISIFHEYASV